MYKISINSKLSFSSGNFLNWDSCVQARLWLKIHNLRTTSDVSPQFWEFVENTLVIKRKKAPLRSGFSSVSASFLNHMMTKMQKSAITHFTAGND